MTSIDNGTIDFKSELLRKSIHFCSLSIPIIYYFITKEVALSILLPITIISVIVDFGRFFIPPLNSFIQKAFGFLMREHEIDSKKKNLERRLLCFYCCNDNNLDISQNNIYYSIYYAYNL